MEEKKAPATSGLEGIVVADTRWSDVDGERGRLILAGRDVEAFAGRASFEEACAIFWQPEASGGPTTDAPSPEAIEAVREALGGARVRAFERIGSLGDALSFEDGMDALRASVAHLSS